MVDPEEKAFGFTTRLGHLPHDVEGFLVQLWLAREKNKFFSSSYGVGSLTLESGISECRTDMVSSLVNTLRDLHGMIEE